MMIRRRTGGLDQKDILTTNVFLDFDEGFAIGKWFDGGFAKRDSNVRANRFGQWLIGSAAKDLHGGSLDLSQNKNPPVGGESSQKSNNRSAACKAKVSSIPRLTPWLRIFRAKTPWPEYAPMQG